MILDLLCEWSMSVCMSLSSILRHQSKVKGEMSEDIHNQFVFLV